MPPASRVGKDNLPGQLATVRLEEVIPIAVVIAAGCERCAERMVERALSQGTPGYLVGRTLGIVARVRSTECIVQAVGPEVIARIEKALRAARRALLESGLSTKERKCCG
jgi:alkylhydroperoxidase/carboxymuconolactone decarboxylase family protein YurZ